MLDVSSQLVLLLLCSCAASTPHSVVPPIPKAPSTLLQKDLDLGPDDACDAHYALARVHNGEKLRGSSCSLESPGPLTIHIHTEVYMEYSECLPTLFNSCSSTRPG